MSDQGDAGRAAPGGRQRVAVLGGGAGGIAAAFALTATQALRDRFEVTVYLPGWRLGGKGASGRDRDFGRIEEHGLHIWFGFYENSFRMLDACLAELAERKDEHVPGRRPARKVSWKTSADAFVDCEQLVLNEPAEGGRWRAYCAPLPAAGSDEPQRIRRWGIRFLVEWAWDAIGGLTGGLPGQAVAADEVDAQLARAAAIAAAIDGEPGGEMMGIAPLDLRERTMAGGLRAIAVCFRKAEEILRRRAGNRAGRTLDAAHIADLVKALTAIVGKRVVSRYEADDRAPFDHLNSLEFRTALSGVGVGASVDEDLRHDLERLRSKCLLISEDTAEASIIRVFYDLAFAYEGGDAARPRLAAGVGIENVVSIAGLHGGRLMRKMRSGMGDVIFAPLHEVLASRTDSAGNASVNFEFFSWVSGIEAEGRSVARIEVGRQVGYAAPDRPYSPFPGHGEPRWPSNPDGEDPCFDPPTREAIAKMRKRAPRKGLDGLAFERVADPLGLKLPPRSLRRGVDFDHVVLAIPIGAHGEAAMPLAGEGLLGKAVAASATVRTQALQLWLSRAFSGPDGLGWPCDGPVRDRISGAHDKPFDTCSDMTHLLAEEAWPGVEGPKSLAYLCGVLDDREGETQEQADARVGANALEFVGERFGKPGSPFWWDLKPEDIFDPAQGKDLAERLQSQYWRANTTPWERYVISLPGSIRHRIRPDGRRWDGEGEPDWDNVAFAGDWTYTPINAGSFEAAVMSGIDAAAALIARFGGGLKPASASGPPWRRPVPPS